MRAASTAWMVSGMQEGGMRAAVLHDRPRQLLQKEGVARRFSDDLLPQVVWKVRALRHRLHQLPDCRPWSAAARLICVA